MQTSNGFIEEGLWEHHLGEPSLSLDAAMAVPDLPVPSWTPPSETFLAATVLRDAKGAAEAWTAFPNDAEPDVTAYRRPFGASPTGSDRTLAIMWSLRFGRPFYVQVANEPIALNAPTVSEATVVQAEVRKVAVRGYPGVLRSWSPRNGQNMYGARLPTLILNWYEGSRLWSVQSTFLAEEDLFRVAESARRPPE